MVNTDNYNPCKQKLFEVLNNFKSLKGTLGFSKMRMASPHGNIQF